MGFRNSTQTQGRRALYHPYNSNPQRRDPALMTEPMRPVRTTPTQVKSSRSVLRKEVDIAIRGVAEKAAPSQLKTGYDPNAHFDDDGLNSRSSLTLKTSGGISQSAFVTDVIKDILRHATECEIQIVPSVMERSDPSKSFSNVNGVDSVLVKNGSAIVAELPSSTNTQDHGRMEVAHARHRRSNQDIIRRALGMETKSKDISPESARTIPSLLSRISPVIEEPSLRPEMSRNEKQAPTPGLAVRESRTVPSLLSRISPAVDDSSLANRPQAPTRIVRESGLCHISPVADDPLSRPLLRRETYLRKVLLARRRAPLF